MMMRQISFDTEMIGLKAYIMVLVLVCKRRVCQELAKGHPYQEGLQVAVCWNL